MISITKPTTDSSSAERELEEQLLNFGTKLLTPPSSKDELLPLLEKMEQLLTMVDQAPHRSMQDALFPSHRALVMTELLRSADKDVQFSVIYCIHEIARITAPDSPYEDDLMKEIFELTVAVFGTLSDVSTWGYTRAVAVLDTVARYKTCLVMLDLELDELVVEMFDHFLKSIRLDHPRVVFLAMKTVMTSIIEEIEEMSLGLLSPLLQSVRKKHKAASPLSWKLGEQVITNSVPKLKPCLMEAVSMGIALDDFSEIVALICQNRYDTQCCNLVKERHNQVPRKRKSENKRTSENPGTSSYPNNRIHQGIPHKRGRPKRNRSVMNKYAGPQFAKVPKQCLDQSLVGKRVKVWWPLDNTFYDGVVDLFDPIKKQHKVLYDDGEEETLDLKAEHWELIEN